MVQQDYSLTQDEQQYLDKRGFMIVDEPFHSWFDQERPVLTLNDPQLEEENPENPGLRYWISSSGGTRVEGAHPSRQGDDELISIIEKTVASNKMWEGDLFTTQEGEPIKVYVLDSAWKNVAEQLVAKYEN